jgi:predicted DNA binding protein
MVNASLTLTIPERTWIGAVSREYPLATFRVRSAQSSDGVGVGFVEIDAPDPAAVIDDVEASEPVQAVEVFQVEDDRAIVQIEAEDPILLKVLDRTGVPVEMPFEIEDGEVHWTLTTTRTRLSRLGSALDDSEIGFVIEHIRNRAEFDQILTETQNRVITAAIDSGYYDSPRRCTQEELAADLDIAKSTCSEILHRAEERIIKRFEDTEQPAITESRQAA